MIETFPTTIEGVQIIHQSFFTDHRGGFQQMFHPEEFKAAGLPEAFYQENISWSHRSVLRGLHIQRDNPQGKLIRCTTGRIQDVWVDVRKGSPTFGKYETIQLHPQWEGFTEAVYLPPGLAHGFLVLSEVAVIQYNCTTPYDKASDGGINWADPALGIEWQIEAGFTPILSDKDRALPTLADWEAAGEEGKA